MRRRDFVVLLGCSAVCPLTTLRAFAQQLANIPHVGVLVSISANFPALYEQAATYVDKILKGANPARLPVEQPSKFQVTVNNKTAQALGLSISPTLAAQVDEIID
jgi:putative ABC transport system substrate-binding protein